MTNAATVSLIPLSHEAEPPTSREELIELPESETLRGVHIAGFNFAYEEAHESSRVDLSEGDFTMDRAKEGHDEPDGSSKLLEEHHATELTLAEGEDDKAPSSKRTTYTAGLESNYVTPLGSITSNTTSGAGSVPSTALYSCTSFGELRDCVKNETQDVKKPDNLGTTDSGDNLQSNAADLLAPRRITSRSDCLSTTATLGDEHTRRESDPARPPSILLRRDTVNTLLSTSTMNSNRPDSSLGGARGMRVRKYASLNFDLDTIVSLDLDYERDVGKSNVLGCGSPPVSPGSRRPRSLATSRRVSFVDTLNGDLSITSISAPGSSPIRSDAIPHTVPIGGSSSPWSLKNLNQFKLTSPPGQDQSPLSLNPQNRLKKKQRASSTPLLLLSSTPHMQEKVALPAGVQQIGLGIGYTYTRPHGAPAPTPVSEQDKTAETSPIPAPTLRRAVPSVGTANAIQRCSALFANLALGRHSNGRKTPSQNQVQGESLGERASEESDALEAVMREMYGASWNAEGSSGYCGGGGGYGGTTAMGRNGAASGRPGRVYSVPGMAGLRGTIARDTQAGSSTLRLVEPAAPGEF